MVRATRQKRSADCSTGFPFSSLIRYRFFRTVWAFAESWGSIREDWAAGAADFGEDLAIVSDPSRAVGPTKTPGLRGVRIQWACPNVCCGCLKGQNPATCNCGSGLER